MPYHGAELQAYLCQHYAKDNGYLYDANGDVFIRATDGYVVAIPLADDTEVLATAYKANSLVKIDQRKTSMPNPYGKRKRCKTVKEAIAILTSTPEEKPSQNCKADDKAVLHEKIAEQDTHDNFLSNEETDIIIDNSDLDSYSSDNRQTEVVPDSKYVGDYELQLREDGRAYRVRVGGVDAGVVDGLCQDYETARANFMQKKNECLNSCNFRKTCALTLGTYIKQSFDDVQKAVQCLVKTGKGILFKKYNNLKCICCFLEPYEKGGWHVHAVACFHDNVPADLYKCVIDAWKKHIIVPEGSYKTDENLVKFRDFYTVDEFVKYLDYLNPISKRKRDRLKFYPYKRKARQIYGDYAKPNSVIMPADEAKKLTECEHPALRHEIKILNASSTVFDKKVSLKLHNFTYYFTTNEKLWNDKIDDSKLENNNIREVDFVPPLTAPEPQMSETISDDYEDDYDDEDERDNSRWSDYVYSHFTMLHQRY